MPRRSGGFGSSSSRPSSSPTRNTQAPAQQPVKQSPPPPPVAQPQQTSGGMFSGIGQTLVSGMAFGAGSEVAHQAVRGLFGGSSHQNQQPVQEQQQQQQQQRIQYCTSEQDSFQQCLQRSYDVAMCQSYFDMMKECQKKYNL